jgi:hypothetical protein
LIRSFVRLRISRRFGSLEWGRIRQRHIGPVFDDEEEASKQDPLQTECGADGLDVEVAGVELWWLEAFRRRRQQGFADVYPRLLSDIVSNILIWQLSDRPFLNS